MGWTVLYIAFGVVALWLLGEVLLQYKARLRWRLLAFAGFLGVVLGVVLPSVIVIGVGAAAFAAGQTYVTLSFRKGFSQGWALGGSPGASRRRKAGAKDPTLEVSELAYEAPEAPEPVESVDRFDTPPAFAEGAADATQAMPEQRPAHADAFDAPDVYEPQPLPEEETGQYGVYGGSPAFATTDETNGGYGSYDGYDQQVAAQQAAAQPQDGYQGQYDYGTQQYAAYSDPYLGSTQGYDATAQYDPYGQYGTGSNDAYGTQQYAADTPPGGVWVPQQRDGERPVADDAELPPEQQPFPYQQPNGYDPGYNEQRY
jgi:hypothetical protein